MNLFAWFWSFCVVIGVLYTALIVWFLNGWKNISIFNFSQKAFNTKVSVIVPFYNEQQALNECVESLLKQQINTAEYEIVLVDDQSEDCSSDIAVNYAEKYKHIKYCKTERQGKKHALLLGVKTAIGKLIVTTDADCVHPENWLSVFVDYFEQNNPNLIVGPVKIAGGKGLLGVFQKLELASLVASGAGAIGIGHAVMCNGANLAFSKQIFESFSDPLNLKYASGDDVFLLHNMKTLDSDKIHFLKSHDALVETSVAKGLKKFIKQRKRWVSKSPGYKDGDTKFTAFVVFAASLLWVLGLALVVCNIDFWKPVVFLFALKTIVDIVFLWQVSKFFSTIKLVKWIPFFQILYGFYVVLAVLAGLLSAKK